MTLTFMVGDWDVCECKRAGKMEEGQVRNSKKEVGCNGQMGGREGERERMG